MTRLVISSLTRFMSGVVLVATLALLSIPATSITINMALAHGTKPAHTYKHANKDKRGQRTRKAHHSHDLPPDRAIFPSQVDLRARGGVERFFELILEQSR